LKQVVRRAVADVDFVDVVDVVSFVPSDSRR